MLELTGSDVQALSLNLNLEARELTSWPADNIDDSLLSSLAESLSQ